MITRCTIDQAAARLGVSRPTIRRRLRNGELRGERKPTKQGFQWEVLLDLPTDSPDDSADGESPTPQAPPQATPQTTPQDEGARLRDEHITDLRKRVEDQAREIAELHRLLAQAQQQAYGRLLTDSSRGESSAAADGESLGSHPTPHQNGSTPPPEGEARRWWQRLLWG
jgi:hypothetical protein